MRSDETSEPRKDAEMNAEIVNKAADVANSAVNALKSSPIVLALVIFQIFTLGAVLYNSIDRQRSNNEQIAALHQLIDKCMTGHIDSK